MGSVQEKETGILFHIRSDKGKRSEGHHKILKNNKSLGASVFKLRARRAEKRVRLLAKRLLGEK